ncbi:MAG TPA: hypothetical protein VK523_04885 [Steroidobacteraceae bacterium]|nr:hypothetical protein [Steroidobacteraceae bacterium]
MMINTDGHFRATLYILRRKPVLTAMMVSSLVLGLTGLAAAITVWHDNSSCSIPRKTVHPYLAVVVEGMAHQNESG